MALSKQAVVITKPDANTVQIAIGNRVYTAPLANLVALFEGIESLDFLIGQFAAALQDAGVNPRTASAAQVKAAVEAQTYYWGA